MGWVRSVGLLLLDTIVSLRLCSQVWVEADTEAAEHRNIASLVLCDTAGNNLPRTEFLKFLHILLFQLIGIFSSQFHSHHLKVPEEEKC